MFLEIFIVLSTLFFVGVWFYKQRRETLEILQLEFSNSAAALHELVEEGQPIVIRNTPVPASLTLQKLDQIPRLGPFPLQGTSGATSATLGAYRRSPSTTLPGEQAFGLPLMTREASVSLAHELALDTWVTHSIQEFLGEFMGIVRPLNSTRTSVVLGGVGMRRSTASYTCILPTEGTYTISLINKRSETFLPAAWKYKYTQNLTVNDTPLVGEIQFIDIVVRPGTMLAIPAHQIYSMKPQEGAKFHAALCIEVHSPISVLGAVLDSYDDPVPSAAASPNAKIEAGQ